MCVCITILSIIFVVNADTSKRQSIPVASWTPAPANSPLQRPILPNAATISDHDCVTCRSTGTICPHWCPKIVRCIPNWSACTGPKKPFGTTNECCSGWQCIKPAASAAISGNRCEPIAQSGNSAAPQECSACMRQRTVCPIGCPKQCIPKWWICAGPKKNPNLSNTCCNGWQCMQPKNPKLRSKRCEPKPPKCVPKWGWRCSGRVRCCGGWRCVRATVKGYNGSRCEPPPKTRNCVPNWHHCTGPKNMFDTNRCCGGWRCVRPRNAPNFNGKRCEPK